MNKLQTHYNKKKQHYNKTQYNNSTINKHPSDLLSIHPTLQINCKYTLIKSKTKNKLHKHKNNFKNKTDPPHNPNTYHH